jgi:tetratricopeptide (TPR) repeat protein
MTTEIFLETESVRMALEAMRQAEPLGTAHPLTRFISIQRNAPRRTLVQGAAATDMVLFPGLERIIRLRLDQHRSLYQLPPASPHTTTTALQDDFRVGNSELESWSVLYHRYVRVDLDLSIERLEEIASQERRTLQRRQSKGISRLTHDLIRREMRVRTRQRQVALRAQLPSTLITQPVGRDDLIGVVTERLSAVEPPRHVLLYGIHGIGKSTVAATVAGRLIEVAAGKQDNKQEIREIQNIAWIDQPDSRAAFLLDQIAAKLGIPCTLESHPSLSEYLHLVDSLIVLDHAQALVDDPQAFVDVLGEIAPARLLICVMQPPEWWPSTHEARASDLLSSMTLVQVPELDKEAGLDLLAHVAQTQNKATDIDYFNQLYNDLGGNPRALREMLIAGRRHNLPSISVGVYGEIWDTAAGLTRLIWLILALSLSASSDMETLASILTECNDSAADPGNIEVALAHLREASVLEIKHDRMQQERLTLTPLALTFALHMLQAPSADAVNAARCMTRYLVVQPDLQKTLHLLASVQRGAVPTSVILDLAYTFAPVLERAGAWLAWGNYLETLRDAVEGEYYLWCALHLGIAFRWQARWNDAAYLFSDVIEKAGRAGLFAIQADAMVELATIYRLRGQRELVGQLLSRAQRFYARQSRQQPGYETERRLERITAEYAQLALDNNDIASAQRNLDEVNTASPRLLSLAASAAMRAGEFNKALQAAQQAQDMLSDDLPGLGRITALIGEIHYRLGDRVLAINHLTYALEIMKQTNDLLGHARARLNLSAIFLAQGNFRATLRYLRDLPAEFERLGDVESLQATLRNLEILNEISRGWTDRRNPPADVTP